MRTIALIVIVLSLVGCERQPTSLMVEAVQPPSATGSAPKLSTNPEGGLVLSWLEKTGAQEGNLQFSFWSPAGWSVPVTAARGELATGEFATAFVLNPHPREFVAFWTEIKDANPARYTEYAYLSRSADDGKTWSHAVPLASDNSKTEHSFLSGSVLKNGAVGVTWLDGRETEKKPYPDGHYHLMTAMLREDGQFSGEKLVDDNVCTCCPTATAAIGDTLLIGYRDRTQDEIRDMNTVTVTESLQVGNPFPVHHDNWRINACPTNGPALDVRDGETAVAWFTSAQEPLLYYASSNDGGKNFTVPEEISRNKTIGHPAISILKDGSTVVAWIENHDSVSHLLARQITKDGQPGPVVEVAQGPGFGFPSMRAQGPDAVITWMQKDPGQPSLHLARLKVSSNR